jgi:V8-like Glu-specific endopeptidase
MIVPREALVVLTFAGLVSAMAADYRPAWAIVRADQRNEAGGDRAAVDRTRWTGVGRMGPGSGVLLDSIHVLTAAHVFFGVDGDGPALAPDFTTMFALVDPMTGQFTNFTSRRYDQGGIAIAPGYLKPDGSGGGHRIVGRDLAVITLDMPVDTTKFEPYAFNAGQIANELIPMPQGKTVLVGFGGTGDGVNAFAFSPRIKREAFNNMDRLGDAVNGVGTTYTAMGDRTKDGKIDPPPPLNTLVWDFDMPGAGNSSGLTNAVMPAMSAAVGAMEGSVIGGDSGGPVFQMADDGRWYIVGITSSGSDTMGRFGSIAYATRVQAYKDFLTTAVPEPSSLALLLTGLGVAALWGCRSAVSRRRGAAGRGFRPREKGTESNADILEWRS